MPSSTSSFRISDELRLRLEEASRDLRKGKNWIINRALEEYRDRTSRADLAAEARRQSQLVSRRRSPDDAFWAEQHDDSGWQ